MTRRDRVVLAVGSGLIAVILGGGKVLPHGLAWHRSTLDEVDLRARAVESLQERLGGASELSDSMAYLEGAVSALPDRLLRGGTAEEAQLDVMRRVRMAAADSSMVLDSVRVVDAVAAADSTDAALESPSLVREIALRAWVTSDLAGIAEFLGGVEGDPALWVDRFFIRTGPFDPAGPEALSADVRVAGWRLVTR